MFNVGGGELLVIALIALIVLGPQRLPDAARTVGRVMGELRRMSSGFQQELKDAFDPGIDDAPSPLRRKESAPLAATVAETDKAAERKAAAVRDNDAGRDTDDADAAADAGRDTDDADAAAGGGGATLIAGTAVAGTPGTTDVPEPVGPPDTVDPAVADAIDEIVAPINPSSQVSPAAAAPGPPASTSSSAPDTPSAMASSDPVDDPVDGPAHSEDLGDQRAAS